MKRNRRAKPATWWLEDIICTKSMQRLESALWYRKGGGRRLKITREGSGGRLIE